MTQQSSPLSSFGRARKNGRPVIDATAAEMVAVGRSARIALRSSGDSPESTRNVIANSGTTTFGIPASDCSLSLASDR
ncbi:hypothetical protein [Roseateles sp.]|uniref:hypothetical protein n=1 Tax=Roseateles sp. TaxID=1971397 RepID=UPI002E04C801|nr:hypothetical protein [Roseateles sp.]